MARLCSATTRIGIWESSMGCPRHLLVSLPLVHAAHIVRYRPNGNLRDGAVLCCTTYQKHVAGHRRTLARQFALLSKVGTRRHIGRTSIILHLRYSEQRLRAHECRQDHCRNRIVRAHLRVPDTRPLSASDLAAANRRHDEKQANSPWFKLWQRCGVCRRGVSPVLRPGEIES